MTHKIYGIAEIRRMVVIVLLLAVTSFLAKPGADGQTLNYGDALTKSILFFEGQRSGKLPPNQRLTWRKDSALHDGSTHKVDLVGGYYDAGDNVKFNFPMAFTATVLAWSVLEYGSMMGPADLGHATDAVVWAADYFMKATAVNGVVYAMVGDPISDHDCWERPEDMDTSRYAYMVNRTAPGSDLAAEIAAALAAASLVLKDSRRGYAANLAKRAAEVFEFGDKFRGVHSASTPQVCPFYCSSSYEDELVWGATWLYKATKKASYLDYVIKNIGSVAGSFEEFGWDRKTAGTNIVLTERKQNRDPFVSDSDRLICSIMPESPTRTATSYSKGGLLFRGGPSNMQHVTALSFLALTYAQYLIKYDRSRRIRCGNVVVQPANLVHLAKTQVDYILGNNPMKMSYMVGYGPTFPQRIHHRGSTLPSVLEHRQRFGCQDGSPYFKTDRPNPNVLVGAVVGGPNIDDHFIDSRMNVSMSEPTTYFNAPFVGLLAYFKSNPPHFT
ncbi:hypothetical protein V2J09_014505 [Rumex salicifolius]